MEVLTVVLIIVTTLYVYLTYKMANSSERSVQFMKEQAEAISRPYLVIQPVIRSGTPLLYLRIHNGGKTAALKLNLQLDKDFYRFDDLRKNLKEAPAFKSTLDSFAPGQELFFALGEGWLILGDSTNPMPQQFTVTATYQYMDKGVVEKTHVDLRAFMGSEGEASPLVDELSKIRKTHEKLVKIIGGKSE